MAAGVRAVRGGSRIRVGFGAIVVAALVVSAIGLARFAPDPGAQAGIQAAVGQGAAVEYGVAEPATTLPGSSSPADLAAWSQIRADVAASGSCWLRSDLTEWLTRAIDALPWLGSPSACSSEAGAPVKVLAIIDQQTVWSAHRLCPDTTFSADWHQRHMDFTLADWGALVHCVATQYRGRISAYEIWNEPLLPYSEMGFEDGSAGNYLSLLRVAYGEIKAADPNATVLALGGSDLYAGGDQARMGAMHAFTDRLVALGARRYADAISVHAYAWGHPDAAVWASYLAELRLQEAAWQLPVWITETGARTTDSGTQSAYVQAAYDLFVRAGVAGIFWFSDTDQSQGTFGLRGRPVEATLRAFADANP